MTQKFYRALVRNPIRGDIVELRLHHNAGLIGQKFRFGDSDGTTVQLHDLVNNQWECEAKVKDCVVLEEMPCVIGTHEQLGAEIGAHVDRRQIEYGDAFGKCGDFLKILYPDGVSPEQYGDMLATVRIFDKLMRIANGGHGDGETPWPDIVGYALLGEMKARQKNK